jgi:hypothetical protein
MDEARFPPGFGASLVGAIAGFLGGGFVAAVVAWPFALVSWTALAVGPPSDDAARRLVLVVVILVALQLLVSAWIAQQAALIVGGGKLRYRRAFAALALGTLATFTAAVTLPEGAALPLLGYSWVGVLLAAWILSSGPPAPSTA